MSPPPTISGTLRLRRYDDHEGNTAFPLADPNQSSDDTRLAVDWSRPCSISSFGIHMTPSASITPNDIAPMTEAIHTCPTVPTFAMSPITEAQNAPMPWPTSPTTGLGL